MVDVSERLHTMSLNIGQKDRILHQGDKKLWELNMPIGQYAEGLDEALDKLMTCWITYNSRL